MPPTYNQRTGPIRHEGRPAGSFSSLSRREGLRDGGRVAAPPRPTCAAPHPRHTPRKIRRYTPELCPNWARAVPELGPNPARVLTVLLIKSKH